MVTLLPCELRKYFAKCAFVIENENINFVVNKMKLHDKIKLLRLSKNFTQTYMAEELGIDTANYSRLERDEVKITTERLLKIAEIFEVDVNSLFNENTEQMEKINSVLILKEILKEIKEINLRLKTGN